MNTNKLLLLFGVLVIVSSQWLSSFWFVQSSDAKMQAVINAVVSAEQPLPNSQSSLYARVVSNTEIEEPIDLKEFEQRLQSVMQRQIQRAIADYTEALNQVGVTPAGNVAVALDSSPSEDAQQAFWAALDIVSDAQIRNVWDESINERLSIHRDRMTDDQRNEIVGQYVQAFKEGLVGPDVRPPF